MLRKTLLSNLVAPLKKPQQLYASNRVKSFFNQHRFFSTGKVPEFIKVEKNDTDKIAVITLNRPKALNALCDQLIGELNQTLLELDSDVHTGAIVITGSEKAFAAGADIKEMSDKTYMDAYKTDMLSSWNNLTRIKTPIIAAVNGFALGGGCELAMMCDIIYAGDRARFGQPEIKLGTIPGCGGTQRLIRAVGKAKAMHLVLTGEMMSAEEAEKAGLVAKVVPASDLVEFATTQAKVIASYSLPITRMCKEAVNASFENTLEQGVIFERRLFHSTFATNDQKEGMSAFKEKRDANFTNN